MGSANERLRIIASVQDGMSKDLRKMGKRVDQLGKKTEKAGKKFGKFGQRIKSAIGPLVAFFGARALVSNFKSSMDEVERLGHLADSIGDTVENVSSLAFAMKNVGIEGTSMTMVMTALERQRSMAIREGGKQLEIFNKLGISLQELKTLGGVDLLRGTLAGMENITGQFERQAVLQGIWTENFRKMVPLAGKALGELEADALASGAVLTKGQVEKAKAFNLEWQKSQTKLSESFRKLAFELMPLIITGLDALAKALSVFSADAWQGLKAYAGFGPNMGQSSPVPWAGTNPKSTEFTGPKNEVSQTEAWKRMGFQYPWLASNAHPFGEMQSLAHERFGSGGKPKTEETEKSVSRLNQALTEWAAWNVTIEEGVVDLVDAFSSGLAAAFQGLIEGAMDVGEAFESLGRLMLKTITQTLAEMAAQSVTRGIISTFTGGVVGGALLRTAPAGGGDTVTVNQHLQFIDAADGQRFIAQHGDAIAAIGIRKARSDSAYRDAHRLSSR